MVKKPELLAPAGNIESLTAAVLYGADAVYIGGLEYGLRAKSGNFDIDLMGKGIKFAHASGVKVYVATNIFARNDDIKKIGQYIESVYNAGADAIIVSDPGVFTITKEVAPLIDIHISTQANNTNFMTANFWYNLGASRIVVARELNIEEISEISSKMPPNFGLEAFVHGAMCISYSGRCYLSEYLSDRDANRGNCSQPCRWKYYLTEENRDGEQYPVFEDKTGTYILNSKDLCLISNIPELVNAGISSFKIEGRMKSPYYVASTVKAYRNAIDDYFTSKELYYSNLEKHVEEVRKTSHRHYTTGFYFKSIALDDSQEDKMQYNEDSKYIRGYDYLASVISYDHDTKTATVTQRNKFSIGDNVEVLRPQGDNLFFEIKKIYDSSGEPLESAPHPMEVVKIEVEFELFYFDILRRKV